MNTRFLTDPAVPAVCLHNTAHWQVAELMGGLACELLRKERVCSVTEQHERGWPAYDCYPSVLLQGDEAHDFLQELREAQRLHPPQKVDALLLDAYADVVH